MAVNKKKVIATILNACFSIVEAVVLWKFVEIAPIVASIIGIVTMTLTEFGINLDVKK